MHHIRFYIVIFLMLFSSIVIADTQSIRFTPFYDNQIVRNQNDVPEITVIKTFQDDKTISCVRSHLSQRPNIWRCTVKKDLFDPCFQFNNHRVLCLSSPWDTTGIEIKANQSLDSQALSYVVDDDGVLPWALELNNGKKCTLFLETQWENNKLPLTYVCNDENHTYLYGNIDRTNDDWTIQEEQKDKILKSVFIKKAWKF